MKNFPVNWRRVGFLFGIGILVLAIIDLNARIEGLNNLNEEKVIVQAIATQARQTQVALQTQVAYAQSDQAAEDYARGEGHMVQDGDIPVVPVGNAESTPVATATPIPVPTAMQNWEVWWNLFFGE